MRSDIDPLCRWIGTTESSKDVATPVPIQALAATLDHDPARPADGQRIPAGWHWLYFLPTHRASGIGTDGHPERGGFLPPVQLPRRMWAAGRLELRKPLHVGESLRRTSRIVDVRATEGRAGPLVFVQVRHEIEGSEGVAIVERQDIVYRGPDRQDESAPAYRTARLDHQWKHDFVPDAVTLFRFSALTFNGHRIHYDRPYATEQEHYPGLVVHGPLVALLLLDSLRREHPAADVRRFSFKAVMPLFDTHPFFLCGHRHDDGTTATLWAKDHAGRLAMEAEATLA